MWIKRLLFLLMLLVTTPLMASPLKVVATSTSVGMLVTEIAAEHARLTVLGPPDRDLHYLQAKPGMIRALRGADLVVAMGAELELGWLPVAISSAANPGILPGKPGYFEAAAQVELLDTGGPADRSLGDVHPAGNPHINMDPVRMAEAGLALAERLAGLDPEHGDAYRARATAFAGKVERRVAEWRPKVAQAAGALLYHKDAKYLLDRLGVPLFGHIEPVPGIPPTPSHLRRLATELQGQRGVILYTVFQSSRAPRSLAETLGWPATRLPLDPPRDADGDAYLAHLARWVDAIAAAKP